MSDATHAADHGHDEPTLPATARALARRAPSALLITLTVGGLLGGGLVATVRPHWWLLGVVAMVFATLGLWGATERALGELRSARAGGRAVGGSTYWLLVGLRAYAAAAATVAGVVVLVFVFHLLVAGIGVGGG